MLTKAIASLPFGIELFPSNFSLGWLPSWLLRTPNTRISMHFICVLLREYSSNFYLSPIVAQVPIDPYSYKLFLQLFLSRYSWWNFWRLYPKHPKHSSSNHWSSGPITKDFGGQQRGMCLTSLPFPWNIVKFDPLDQSFTGNRNSSIQTRP